MDYHAVADVEIKAFPELNLPSGTRSKHQGRVKAAVVHYLRYLLGVKGYTEGYPLTAEDVPALVVNGTSYEFTPSGS
jgi:hypothetical protein